MKLFYSKGACSLVVRIVLNELGIKANYEAVNLKHKTTEHDDDFYTINPKGSVPVLQLDNGNYLSENVAILQYLADNNNSAESRSLLAPVPDFKRYQILEWLNFITTEVHKTFALLFNPTLSEALKQEAIPIIKLKFNLINQRLAQQQYLVGEDFTLADAYLFAILLWTRTLNINIEEWPSIALYFQRLHSKKSIQFSLEQEGIVAI